MARRPLIVVIAGPNGAGKSTMAPHLLRGAFAVSEFVNADTIARGLSAFRPETMGLAAGRVMVGRIRSLARARADFAFETTLASRTFAPWLRKLRAGGYRTHMAFLALPTPELALARVRERARRGGHDVPEDVVRRRFAAGVRNFFGMYRELLDTWQVFDNSEIGGPRLVAAGRGRGRPTVADPAAWNVFRELER